MSEALARVSKGNIYLIYKQKVGEALDEGLGGIYQLPQDRSRSDFGVDKTPNAWRTWEFETIQRHSDVEKIYSVDASKGFPLDNVEWERGKGQREMPDSYAMDLELPPLSGSKARVRRDACPASFSTTPRPTGGPTPACTYVGLEPPLTPKAFCTCDSKSSLPLTSIPKTPIPIDSNRKYIAQADPTFTSQEQKENPAPSLTTIKGTC